MHRGKIGVPANAVLDATGGEQKGFVLLGIVPAQAKQFPTTACCAGCVLGLPKRWGILYGFGTVRRSGGPKHYGPSHH